MMFLVGNSTECWMQKGVNKYMKSRSFPQVYKITELKITLKVQTSIHEYTMKCFILEFKLVNLLAVN